MKQIQIKIEPAPADLLTYTHATLEDTTANSLRSSIEKLQEQGVEVLEACGPRSAVPNSYGRSAHRMKAPAWKFDGKHIYAEVFKLETRPRGATIPAWFKVTTPETLPEGFRCFKKSGETSLLRVR